MAQQQMTVSEALKAGYTHYGVDSERNEEYNAFELSYYMNHLQAGDHETDTFLYSQRILVHKFSEQDVRDVLANMVDNHHYANTEDDHEKILEELDISELVRQLNAVLGYLCTGKFEDSGIIVVPDPQPAS